MQDLAPSEAEATVVTVLTAGGVVAALALLATLAVLRRRRASLTPPPAERPVLGLGLVGVLAAVLLFLGGAALAWPAVMALLGALVAAIPFLPKWYRGLAAFAAALAPVWIGLAVFVAIDVLDGVTRRLTGDGYTVAVARGGSAGTMPYLITPALIVPIVAVRAWSVRRRRA